MNRIDLRGVIVPSDYDTEWAKQYIERGILMPESYFRRQLADAPADAPLEVYVNSPGGSVFAANEMINAVREWKLTNSQPVTVIVGAMAASAASSFTVAVADSVQAHSNSLMMFHGAYTISFGGKELHEDTAELLGKINADTQTRLVSKYNIAPETVSEWFAESREGWLTADEMKAVGIASEIIGDPADALEFPEDSVLDIEQRGIGIAALLSSNVKTQDAPDEGDEGEPEGGDNDGNDTGADDDAGGEGNEGAEGADAGDEGGDEGDSESAPEPSAERIAGREEGRQGAVAEYADRVAELTAKIDGLNALAAQMQSERDKARDELAKAVTQHEKSLSEMSEQLRAATDRVAKFLDGSLTFSPSPQSWQEALKACDGNYEQAAKQYPELRDKYNAENSRK